MKFIILFNFIIFILFCLLFQKIKIYDLLVIIIMFSYFKGNLFNILIFLFCFNLLLKFAFYVKNELSSLFEISLPSFIINAPGVEGSDTKSQHII